MTRANFTIITEQGKFKLQANSSAYPSNVMDDLLKFAMSTATENAGGINGFYDEPDPEALSNFINDLYLTLGHVGNPTYFYDVDFVNKRVKVWGYASRWINAPSDWKERGWNCWVGKNGKYGYTSFVKGRNLYDKSFDEVLVDVVEGKNVGANLEI